MMVLTQAIALAGLMFAAENPAPLTATGKWTVNFPQTMCVAERNYGPDDRSMIVALRPVLVTRSIEVRISEVDPSYVSRIDVGSVTLKPSGRTLPAKITSFGPVTNGRRVTSFYIEDVELSDLVTASAISIDRGRAGAALQIVTGDSTGLIASMARCGDDILHGWGVDPVAMHKLSRQPQPVGGAERNWFKPRDYPKTARSNFRSGRTLARVTIGVDGRVAGCNIAESAGNPDLDSKTCTVLAERGRYDPGLDAAGTPVSSQKLVAVMWTMWPLLLR